MILAYRASPNMIKSSLVKAEKNIILTLKFRSQPQPIKTAVPKQNSMMLSAFEKTIILFWRF